MKSKMMRNAIALLLITFAFTSVSCIPHIHGNGKVVKEERSVANFEAISVSNGIEVLINQDTFQKVVAETDENIQKILKTVVSGGKLKIYMEEGVLHTKKLKVYVTVKSLKSVEGSSGSNVKTDNKITAENLKIDVSSGSHVSMEVACNQLKTESSSGSHLSVSGTAQSISADSSSGASIDAASLVAEKGNASASSGAHVKVQVTKDLKAHASSGGGVTVLGNPATRDTDSSSGGSVNFK